MHLHITVFNRQQQFLPFVFEQETGKVKAAIRWRPISIIFDGTTHECEAMGIVVRYLTDDWVISKTLAGL